MKQSATIVLCLCLILVSAASMAEARTFKKTYTYSAGSLDNEFSSQVIAKARVKEMILDSMEIRAKELYSSWNIPYPPEEYVRAFMSCLSKVEVLKEDWKDRKYTIKARTRSNLTRVAQDMGTFVKRSIPTDDITENRRAARVLLKTIESINTDAASSSDSQNVYDDAVRRLHAADWYEKARFADFAGDYDEAIASYTKAIEFRPYFAWAYRHRGRLYRSHLKDTAKGREDLAMAVKLMYDHAVSEMEAKRFPACVGSITAALRIQRRNSRLYYQRAACRVGLGQQEEAKEDFKMAARFGHKQAREMLEAKGIEWKIATP